MLTTVMSFVCSAASTILSGERCLRNHRLSRTAFEIDEYFRTRVRCGSAKDGEAFDRAAVERDDGTGNGADLLVIEPNLGAIGGAFGAVERQTPQNLVDVAHRIEPRDRFLTDVAA